MRDTLYKVWPFKGALAAELFSFSYVLVADRAVISETLEMNVRTYEREEYRDIKAGINYII